MLSKEDAEKMANEILQKERGKSQSKLAKKSSSIDRIYKTKNLAKVPQYQHILLFRQAKSLAEDHPLYNKMWYGYLVLALDFLHKSFFNQFNCLSFTQSKLYMPASKLNRRFNLLRRFLYTQDKILKHFILPNTCST